MFCNLCPIWPCQNGLHLIFKGDPIANAEAALWGQGFHEVKSTYPSRHPICTDSTIWAALVHFLTFLGRGVKKTILYRKRPALLYGQLFVIFLVFFWPYLMIICVLNRILYTRKSQFSFNYCNPQFLLLLLLPSGWSFARDWPLILTTTKRAWKMHLWDPSQWDKMCFECQRIKFQSKKVSKFSHLLTVRAPTLPSAWPWNIRFFDASP